MTRIRLSSSAVALVLASATVVLPPARSQDPSASPIAHKTVVGTVGSVSTARLTVLSGKQKFILIVGAHSRIWPPPASRDLSTAARRGDVVAARCRVDASGRLFVESLWVNAVTVSGTILKVTTNGIAVLANPNADPQSAYKTEIKTVVIDPKTTFDASSRDDLLPGRHVEIVGSVVGSRTVRASKITVYEGDRPVRMRSRQTIIAPNGQFKKH